MLANMFPGNYYSGDESKALDFMGYFAHQKQQDEAFKNQELNRQMALEDMLYNQQKRPLELTKLGLDNQGLEALLPGKRADSGIRELNFAKQKETQAAEIKAALAKEALNMTQDELKAEHLQIQRQLDDRTISPQVRQVLELIRDNFPENYKLNQLIKGKETVAQVAADAGVKKATIAANKPPAPKGGGGPAATKPPGDDLKLATYFEFIAGNEKDEGRKAQYQALAEAARKRHYALIQAKEDAKKAGGVDLSATGVATRPPITAPTGAPAPKPAAAPSSVIRMKDKSGKVYSIPAARKQEALADGLIVLE